MVKLVRAGVLLASMSSLAGAALAAPPTLEAFFEGAQIRSVAISPSGRTFIAYGDDESHNIVDLLLVTDLEVPANGFKKRKKT